MKKILFLQLLGNSYGGIWQVNKLIGEKLIKKDYDVRILSLRNIKGDSVCNHDKSLKVDVINDIEEWNYPLKSQVVKFDISILEYFKRMKKIKNDYQKMSDYIIEYNPDHIIVSHYLLLNTIPKEFLDKTIYQQHSSAQYAFSQRGNRRTLFKYNNKVTFLWLCKASCDRAIKEGLNNCYYIYNAVRFNNDKIADVVNNKKIVTIARLSYEKRIDLMIKIVNELFENNDSLNDWTFEIYGSGEIEEELLKLDFDRKKIKIMGITDNPEEVLLSSSINLNTSLFEGFSLSILEATECGVPTVSFNFGESAFQQILNNKTGVIADNLDNYKKELLDLMTNKEKLLSMSNECKNYSKSFCLDKIINDWIKLFDYKDNKI